MGHRHVALTVGSRALGAFEPRQIRKEAALRTPSQVPRHRPARAGGGGTTRGRLFDDGARDRAYLHRDPAPASGSATMTSMTALYRTYRPLDFTQVVGQETVVRTLRNAIEHDQVRQAYLFAGPARDGQDVDGAHPREGAERRGRAVAPTSTRRPASRARSPTAPRSTSSRWTPPRSAGSTRCARSASARCSSRPRAATRSTSSTRRTSSRRRRGTRC